MQKTNTSLTAAASKARPRLLISAAIFLRVRRPKCGQLTIEMGAYEEIYPAFYEHAYGGTLNLKHLNANTYEEHQNEKCNKNKEVIVSHKENSDSGCEIL